MPENNEGPKRLLTDFPPVSTEAWEEVIHTDLKGGDYNRKLVWRTLEGFNVQPYYRSDDLEKLPNCDGQPGEYPYLRGNYAHENKWLIRQDITVTDFAEANSIALDCIERGADSIGFVLPTHGDPAQAELRQLVSGISPLATELNFINPGRGDFLFPKLDELFQSMGSEWKSIRGSVGFSQLAWLTMHGRLCKNHGGPVNRARKAMQFRQSYPGMQVLAVDGRVFHNAGASAVQELAFTLAQAAQYLDWLTDSGFEAAEIAPAIRFNFSVGPLYFIEIAKLRAARYLWTRLLEAYGVTEREAMRMQAHAETSAFNQTVYDPHVNLLRASTESMSAIIAGIHSLRVLPFDTPYAAPNGFSRRLARNAQLLLRDESYFNKVVDPGGGSYYVETLTNSIIKATWELFLEVQEKGGFVAAYRDGSIGSQIASLAAERRKRIATRRDTLLGTNEFPNFNEQADAEVIKKLMNVSDQPDCGCHHDPTTPDESLCAFRGAEQFEQLRFKTDSAERQPVAFMLALGNLAMRRARAQFSCNFLACAGFKVIDNIGFKSVDEGLAKAREAKADIIVLCSSDDEYAELGAETFPKLKDDEILIIAGAPACQPDLEKIGVKYFISVRSNLLETLQILQQELGIVDK